MNYSNHYARSGNVYFIQANGPEMDGKDPKSGSVWLNRLGVVISSQDDIDQFDYVFVVPLSKSAVTNPWYDDFSPAQAYVQYRGEERVALCSKVVAVKKDSLNGSTRRGCVTADELLDIVNMVRDYYPTKECFRNCLYSAGKQDNEPQVG